MVKNSATYLTVLVVDNIEDSRSVLRRALEMKDMKALEAFNGEETVEAAQRDCPDLILIDLNLPKPEELMAAKQI